MTRDRRSPTATPTERIPESMEPIGNAVRGEVIPTILAAFIGKRVCLRRWCRMEIGKQEVLTGYVAGFDFGNEYATAVIFEADGTREYILSTEIEGIELTAGCE